MKIKLLKLGMMVTDDISGVKGMLTHVTVCSAVSLEYIFQPRSLSPATGMPVNILFLHEGRVRGGVLEDVDVPVELIGTKAEDICTGYKGKIAQIVYHMNGCVHVGIKPPGLNKEGNTFGCLEFDIRQVKGPALKPLTSKEMEKSKKKDPSPIPVTLKPS